MTILHNDQWGGKTCFKNTNKSKGSCNNGNENKNLLKHNHNISNTMRIANIINKNNGLGKKIHFGNAYTQNNFSTSYLGTTEGQPGGIGKPPRNKF
jgi:hypothetical protein